MGKALDGVRVLDLTHVQSGPSCTQILAWLGADVIKIERPGCGDITRTQLREVPGADSLYFTMLNCNKRSIMLNLRTEKGAQAFARLVRTADVLVENFGLGVIDRLGFGWERLQELNARLIYASIKGCGPGPYEDLKSYEPIAQAMGGAMSTTGFADGPPTVTGAQIGDSGSGIHLVAAILAALYQRVTTSRGQQVTVFMQESVLNLCRVKLRDHQRLMRGPLPEHQDIRSEEAVPRSGNDSGGGHPGQVLQCAPGGSNDYVYLIIQPPCWAPLARLIGRPELADDPEWSTPEARFPRLGEVFKLIEQWTTMHTKFDVIKQLRAHHVPCGPVLSTKELIEDSALYETGALVRVQHPQRGSFITVGSPLRLSDSPVEITASPLLGEHNEEILRELGYSAEEIAELPADRSFIGRSQ